VRLQCNIHAHYFKASPVISNRNAASTAKQIKKSGFHFIFHVSLPLLSPPAVQYMLYSPLALSKSPTVQMDFSIPAAIAGVIRTARWILHELL